ncbi:MAG: hypothetical protein AB1512_22235 [Thermodesulfobacteriota bacterium]
MHRAEYRSGGILQAGACFIKRRLSLGLVVFLLWVPFVSAPGVRAKVSPLEGSRNKPQEAIQSVRIFLVRNGELREKVLRASDLTGDPVSVADGYVSGVAVFGSAELEVTLDGRRLKRAERGKHGVFSGQVPAILKAQGFSHGMDDTTPDVEIYALFPAVPGEAVSPGDEFTIAFRSGSEVLRVPFRQQGYRTVCPLPPNSSGNDAAVSFEYLGSGAGFLDSEPSRLKLRAIQAGIDDVQRVFREQLVRNVRIIEYNGIRNAIACEEEEGIWLYAGLFRDESPDELEVMARHETLHKLVEKRRLSSSSALRAWFADLKGFDALSYERLLLMTKGVTSHLQAAGPSSKSVFFSFIDEMNFMGRTRGGHSDENLAEFCASYLHSLMYVKNLARNLERPLRTGEKETPRPMTRREKEYVLNAYGKTAKVLGKSGISLLRPEKSESLLQDIAALLDTISRNPPS